MMKVQDIYDYVIEKGIKADPRGEDQVKEILEKNKEQYEKLEGKEKEYFDVDSLFNPYSDTRVLYGDSQHEVKRMLVGIDIEVGEVLLADKLSEKDRPIDLIMTHHPDGKALDRAVDVARILGIPIMSAHTVADNQVAQLLQETFDVIKPRTLDDIVKILKEHYEYREATRHGAGPEIILGSGENRAGLVLVDMTEGTSGSEKSYEKMSQAGIGTIICMHMGEKHRKEAEKHRINVIIAGHIASDSIGMNLLLDYIEDNGVEIVPCSGLIRNRWT